ncbi:MAG: FG-GAP repeat protein, partial [Anaerolineae bacterium]|nr:FG-GAP repeat protein [Anaerolineae bacterium]
MKRQRLTLVGLIGLLILGLVGPAVRPGRADFDGDGYADLAVGVPYENVGSTTDAGSVSVIYGTSDGLSGTADEYWQQNYLDGSNVEPYDYFGKALAVGDFDGDGYFDLAVGVPGESVGSVAMAGAVNVIYGTSDGGLDRAGNQYWNQDEAGMGDSAETDDHFGQALAAGDFNGDGYDDLAVGIPGEDIGSTVDAGGMMVLYGSASGLTAAGTVWNEAEGAETGDEYGSTLAAGDFDNDGYDELA